MPDDGTGEKTEEPTPKRKEEAREEGKVARSQELNSAFTLLGSFMVLYFLFNGLFTTLGNKMVAILSFKRIPVITPTNSFRIIMEQFYFIARLVGPVLLASAIIGGLISFLQVGAMFTTKSITPRFSNINPVSGLKNLVSLKSLIELVKSLAKAAVIAILAYNQIRKAWPVLLTMPEQGIEASLLFIGSLIFRIAVSIIIFLIVLGIADYIYQRWEFNKNLKMTKQEVKEERKQMEGDPQLKSRRREKQRQLSLNRMMAAMEEADVVITNPTHIAVALKYELETMEAPVLLAKGEGFIAEKIKEKARELEIEIVENKPLARALNESTEIGQEIPADLYQAVAEVLAFIYKSNNRF